MRALSFTDRGKRRARKLKGLTLAGIAIALLALLSPAAQALPDNRGYELVSPVDNLGGNVGEPENAVPIPGDPEYSRTRLLFHAAADGHAIVYPSDPISESGGSGARGYNVGNEILAERTAGGWSSSDIEPSPGPGKQEIAVYQSFSDDLSIGVLSLQRVTPLTPEAPAGYPVLYTRRSDDGAFAPMFTVTPPNRTPSEFEAAKAFKPNNKNTPVFAGASANFEHQLFEANDALTPGALDGGSSENNLYDSIDGQLHLVNVLPDGTTEPNATFGGPYRGNEQVGVSSSSFIHAISDDGSKIFWTDLNTGDLYVREDGTRTVQVDASVGGGGLFWAGSADGSRVIFTKEGSLYEYRVDNGQTIDIAPAAEVQGVVGASEDGSYVYFAASAALTSGATPQDCAAESGSYEEIIVAGCNLYVWHEGEPTRLVAKISAMDNNMVGPEDKSEYFGDWRAGIGNRTAETTPDGQHLVFMSHAELTGYKFDHREGPAEVYVYDFKDGRLSCASCDPTGEPPTHVFVSAYLMPSISNTVTHRWISEDGTRVFFASVDPLVSQDTNGAADVYEWESDGTGECHAAGGCIYLLSSGSDAVNAYSVDASASGDDVFIVTRAQLVSQDENENLDMYDVRIDARRPLASPDCVEAVCEEAGAAAVAPAVFAAPSSSTFVGSGNVVSVSAVKQVAKHKSTRCKKRLVRRRGKCVKRKVKSKKARRSARGRK